jgi:hypothetical protein
MERDLRLAIPFFRPLVVTQLLSTSGDIIYIYVFGNPILVLNSAAAASDLLEKRGSNYSSRPVRTMVTELCVTLPALPTMCF